MIRSNKAQVMILTGCASGIGRHLAGVLAAQEGARYIGTLSELHRAAPGRGAGCAGA